MMRSGLRVSLLLSVLLAAGGAAAQQSQAGRDGAAFGDEVLGKAQEQAESMGHDANGGVRGSGTITIDGKQIDVNDIVPGADRAEVDKLTDEVSFHNIGQEPDLSTIEQSIRQEGDQGDAARILLYGKQMSKEEALQGGWLQPTEEVAAQAASGQIEQIFADCKTTTSTQHDPLHNSTQYTEHTCSRGQDGAVCARRRVLNVSQAPSSFVDVFSGSAPAVAEPEVMFTATVDASDPDRMPSFTLEHGAQVRGAQLLQTPSAENGWSGSVLLGTAALACAAGTCPPDSLTVRVVMEVPGPIFVEDSVNPGQCEPEAELNACTTTWACADTAPRTINGIRVDRDFAQRHGLMPIAPGVAAPLCWVAQATMLCPLCEGEGQANCPMAEVSTKERNTCGVYERDRSCQHVGQVCVIRDEQGNCLSRGETYRCAVEVETQQPPETVLVNSCDAALPCLGDGCRSPDQLNEGSQGDAMLQVAANMAVTSAVLHDWQQANEPGARGSAAPGGGMEPQRAGASELATQWGYDSPDTPERLPGEQLPLSGAGGQVDMANVQIFKGNPYACRKGWGGLVECCSKTKSDAQARYWKLYQETRKSVMGPRVLADNQGSQSGWQQMANGQASQSSLNTPFTSVQENVSAAGGGSNGAGSGADVYDDNLANTHTQFMTEARKEIKPGLSPKWICNDNEFDLAVQREVGMCSYAGTYCSKKVLGVCLQRKEAYCCYSSPMSRMLRASVEPGGVPNLGNPKAPDCRGITPDRLDEIQWDKIPMDELVGRMGQAERLPQQSDMDNGLERYTGGDMTLASAGQPNAADRTTERVDAIASDAVRDAIAEDIDQGRPAASGIDTGPAFISFSPAYVTVGAGGPARIRVSRSGGNGAVSAQVQLVEGDPQLVGFYSQTLSWVAGDMEDKYVSLVIAPEAIGTQHRLAIDGVLGGLLGAAPSLTLVVREH